VREKGEAREQPKRTVIPSAEWASGFTGETQVYVIQPFIGNLGSRETAQATSHGKHCCPLCAKKASVQRLKPEEPKMISPTGSFWIACVSSEDQNYVTQPLIGNLGQPPAWEIYAAQPSSENKLAYASDIGPSIPLTSFTIGPDADSAVTFTAREGRLIVNGQHLRGFADRAYGERHSDRIVLQGSVVLEYYKQNDRANVKAERVVLNLADGSMQLMGAGELSTDFVKTPLFGPWAN
jgi:hypothetical protein